MTMKNTAVSAQLSIQLAASNPNLMIALKEEIAGLKNFVKGEMTVVVDKLKKEHKDGNAEVSDALYFISIMFVNTLINHVSLCRSKSSLLVR